MQRKQETPETGKPITGTDVQKSAKQDHNANKVSLGANTKRA